MIGVYRQPRRRQPDAAFLAALVAELRREHEGRTAEEAAAITAAAIRRWRSRAHGLRVHDPRSTGAA